jgi:V-type H+-transporting ATPase subunit C
MRAGASTDKPYAELHKIDVPVLLVGTLDSLMTLSDELAKYDQAVESVVKKIMRTSHELSPSASSSERSSSAQAPLLVGGVDPEKFVLTFGWDFAKFPHRRPLRELVQLITQGAGAVEEEMKNLSTTLAEKQGSLQELKRKKGGSMLAGNLGDILSDDVMRGVRVVDTEYLKTIFVAVPRNATALFESTYESIGSNLVNQQCYKGSPIVPGSLKHICDDKESSLYAIMSLKGQYRIGGVDEDTNAFNPGSMETFEEAITKEAREKRFIVKQFVRVEGEAGESDRKLEKLEAEVEHFKASFTRWCRTHYGEAFAAWLHIKIIRVFVESVLRYGLPVNITCGVYKVKPGKELLLANSLEKAFVHLGGGVDMEEEEDKAPGEEDYLPYVSQKLTLGEGN